MKTLGAMCRLDRREKQNVYNSMLAMSQHARWSLQELVEQEMEGQVLGDMELQSFDEHDFEVQDIDGQSVLVQGLKDQ